MKIITSMLSWAAKRDLCDKSSMILYMLHVYRNKHVLRNVISYL